MDRSTKSFSWLHIFTWELVESHICFQEIQESLEEMKEMERWMERTKQPKSYRGTPLFSLSYLSYIQPQLSLKTCPLPPVPSCPPHPWPVLPNTTIPTKASAALSMLGYAAKDKWRGGSQREGTEFIWIPCLWHQRAAFHWIWRIGDAWGFVIVLKWISKLRAIPVLWVHLELLCLSVLILWNKLCIAFGLSV